jgi:hypothetical protein
LGLIVVPDNGTIHLAPTFDHASGFGRNEPDKIREERLKTKDAGRSMKKFVQRANSAFYQKSNDPKPLSTLGAFCEAAERRPEAARFWISRLEQVSAEDTRRILNKVPDDELTAIGKEFTWRLLELNKQRILSVKSSI